MASFEVAIQKTLAAEGRFFDKSATTGEVVNFGITLALLRDKGIVPPRNGPPTAGEIDFVRNLTESQARSIYVKYFWDTLHGDDIVDQALADKIFDLHVNTGHGAIFLQHAFNKLNWPGAQIAEDGIVGPATIAAVNETDPVEMLAEIRTQAKAYYERVAAENPELAGDLQGWLDRLASS